MGAGPQVGYGLVLAEMSSFEADAYAHMLDRALARHARSQNGRYPVRLPRAGSYVRLEAILREWAPITSDAVLLRDRGGAVRVPSVADLEDHESWPPRGVLAASDGTWVLESDGRIMRLY